MRRSFAVERSRDRFDGQAQTGLNNREHEERGEEIVASIRAVLRPGDCPKHVSAAVHALAEVVETVQDGPFRASVFGRAARTDDAGPAPSSVRDEADRVFGGGR